MRQILLLFLYSKPTPTKSSLLLMLASAYPSIDNYLLLPFSQPILPVLSPCGLHAPPPTNTLTPSTHYILRHAKNYTSESIQPLGIVYMLHTSVLIISTIMFVNINSWVFSVYAEVLLNKCMCCSSGCCIAIASCQLILHGKWNHLKKNKRLNSINLIYSIQ